MLSLTQVSVVYNGTLTALHEVDLQVPAGGVVALLGSNGAGKTTLLRAVSQNLRRHHARISGGSIEFEGTELVGRRMSDVVRRGIIQVPEGRRIFGRLSVEENLRIGGMGRPRRAQAESRDYVYDLFPRLAERREQRGLLLSGGEQQMLAIGRALMSAPRLLMLDEPSLGLAPKVVDQVAQVIRTVNAAGTAVLLIEQNANMALSVATDAYVLELGRVSLSGTAEELAATDAVKHLYLGHSTAEGAAEVTAEGDPLTATVRTGRRLLPWKEDRQ